MKPHNLNKAVELTKSMEDAIKRAGTLLDWNADTVVCIYLDRLSVVVKGYDRCEQIRDFIRQKIMEEAEEAKKDLRDLGVEVE